MSKPRSIARYGALSPPPQTELQGGDHLQLAVNETLLQGLSDLVAAAREAARQLVRDGLPPELAGAGVETTDDVVLACRALGRDHLRVLARLPRRVRLGLDLLVLLERLDAAEGPEAGRLAFLAGGLAARLHLLPWEAFVAQAFARERLRTLPPEARLSEGPRQAQRQRWAAQRKARQEWRWRALEIWREAPELPAAQVARRLVSELPAPRPAVSTVRKALRGLQPGQ